MKTVLQVVLASGVFCANVALAETHYANWGFMSGNCPDILLQEADLGGGRLRFTADIKGVVQNTWVQRYQSGGIEVAEFYGDVYAGDYKQCVADGTYDLPNGWATIAFDRGTFTLRYNISSGTITQTSTWNNQGIVVTR